MNNKRKLRNLLDDLRGQLYKVVQFKGAEDETFLKKINVQHYNFVNKRRKLKLLAIDAEGNVYFHFTKTGKKWIELSEVSNITELAELVDQLVKDSPNYFEHQESLDGGCEIMYNGEKVLELLMSKDEAQTLVDDFNSYLLLNHEKEDKVAQVKIGITSNNITVHVKNERGYIIGSKAFMLEDYHTEIEF